MHHLTHEMQKSWDGRFSKITAKYFNAISDEKQEKPNSELSIGRVQIRNFRIVLSDSFEEEEQQQKRGKGEFSCSAGDDSAKNKSSPPRMKIGEYLARINAPRPREAIRIPSVGLSGWVKMGCNCPEITRVH
ncbi:hypothetical protein CDAR_200551 [Caerostris darwini]|uniref:Uncharacterized protein n=1 Tax=Caerostris darwini TaxID=1538125 RepID=A0AAV4TXQ9_9ARAC|nr:hypothetical protein CDAR_200551 [Caerostris darwini]